MTLTLFFGELKTPSLDSTFLNLWHQKNAYANYEKIDGYTVKPGTIVYHNDVIIAKYGIIKDKYVSALWLITKVWFPVWNWKYIDTILDFTSIKVVGAGGVGGKKWNFWV